MHMSHLLHMLLREWLENPPKAKIYDACHVAFVFSLGIESGCLEDLLHGAITVRGGGFTIREGGLRGRHVAIILAGAGQDNARRATEILIAGHRPRCVISAGFAGGLCPSLNRNDILIADRLLTIDGCELSVELPPGLSAVVEAASRRFALTDERGQHQTARRDAASTADVHRGTLLTTDRVVRMPSERKALFDRTGALAVDMETFAVAEVCAARQVAFSSIRVINDTADETLPCDMEHLLAQKTPAARLGAALGAVWRRPASAKEMYQLRENALVASGRLAKFLADQLSES
jgi:adenosylhomocysteine nucleosidase